MSIRKCLLSGVLALSLAASGAHASPSGPSYGGSSSNDNLLGFAVIGLVLIGVTLFVLRQEQRPFFSTKGTAPSGPNPNTHPEQRDTGRILMEF